MRIHRGGGDRGAGTASRTETASRTDAELARRAAAADAAAFGELYRRHSDAAWRLAQAVTGNAEDAADAVADAFARVLQALPSGRLVDDGEHFRAYLLATTRNAAIDALRRNERLRPTDRVEELDSAVGTAGPSERVSEDAEATMVAQAFRSLPERWRSVLWLTEVEGIPPRDVADRMGLTPNSAAQLAVRARAGLRERWLQAHLGGRVRDECRWCVEHLGAYVAGRLVPRHQARCEQHLTDCAECQDRLGELRDVGSALKRVVLPVPLALGPDTLSRWARATAATGPASALRAGPLSPAMARAQKPLLALSTGILALGVISATVMGGPGTPRRTDPAAPIAVRPASPQLVADPPVDPVGPLVIPDEERPRDLRVAVEGPVAAEPPAPAPEVVVPAPPGAGLLLPEPLGGVVPNTPAGESLPVPLPDRPVDLPLDLSVAVDLAPLPVEVAVDTDRTGCTGLVVTDLTIGCTERAGAAEPAAVAVAVAVDVPALGPVTVQVPALPSLLGR